MRRSVFSIVVSIATLFLIIAAFLRRPETGSHGDAAAGERQ